MVEPGGGFDGVGLVEGSDEAGTEIEGEIDSASIGDWRVFREGDGAAIHIQDGFASPVVVRNDFGAEGEAGTTGVFTRAVDVVGVEGEGFEIGIPVEGKGAEGAKRNSNKRDERTSMRTPGI